uniref:SUN domain-containing ossification factor n=1 Tax=Esox lucius TaxID=8010 RepID=A0A6Q2Z7L8_ESOLU
ATLNQRPLNNLCCLSVKVEGQAVDSGGRETDPSVPSKEDIPTFDEWKKQVMEVEKEKTLSLHTSTSGSQPVKKVQKNFKNNYASVECGAKILSANTEAKSTSAILMENMDLYMLNPCSNKIWFVIELCEPIQVKQLDVANFELFSSTPKDFLVSISDRYPTNKWVKLGTFHARDERTVQSFPLDEQLYAKYVKMFIKYIKVELISHFGSEHFCPLSLIRVFGTSMVEEYEEIADSQYPSERLEYLEEDYDYPPGYLPSEDKGSKNLLGSATSMYTHTHTHRLHHIVLSPISHLKCAFLSGSTVDPDRPAPQDVQEIPSSPSTSPGPSLSEDIQIVTLVEDEEEEPPLSTVTLMEEEGDDEAGEQEEQWVRESQLYCPLPSSVPPLSPFSCVATLPELLRRWCNARLARERQNGLRKRRKGSPAETPEDTPLNIQVPVPDHTQDAPPSTDTDADTEPSLQSQNEEVPSTNQHHYTQPTDNPTLEPVIVLEPSQTSTLPTDSFSHTSLSKPTPTQEETPPASSLDDPAAALQGAPVQETQQASTLTPTPPAGPDSGDLQGQGELGESSPQPTEHLRGDESVEDLLLSIPVNANGQLHRTATDFYAELQSAGEYVGGNGGLNIHSSSQKESVFMRLNNRIKALEMNMSLSSRYLEELSQRYRKQMEEMQRAFNKTIIKLQNTSRIAEEQDQRQTESIQMLQGQLENITKLMINLTVTVSQLQREVSDRQSYLVVSLFLCLCLGLLLCLQCCKTSTTHPITHTTANHYPSPKRCFSSYDDMSLKRRVACPLVRSKSFTFPTSEGGPSLKHKRTFPPPFLSSPWLFSPSSCCSGARRLGAAGLKAFHFSPIRDHIDRTYGQVCNTTCNVVSCLLHVFAICLPSHH